MVINMVVCELASYCTQPHDTLLQVLTAQTSLVDIVANRVAYTNNLARYSLHAEAVLQPLLLKKEPAAPKTIRKAQLETYQN